MTFSEYLEQRGRGELTRIQYATRISYPTLLRAKAGKPMTPAHARAVSEAAGGEVSAELLERGTNGAAA